ncbi:DUF1707 domain-containing protein [Streptomyces sp. I05A-00742]|uniref:DUF1707 SHOCT-like domain-containing protein n=1 Tax=Streptomyces sp. I05A-00742 TaxID=2732853 RepID=UPI001489771A|nr:DUF1707 domain-containing protein [Streptomyces sp. I05A-00742]
MTAEDLPSPVAQGNLRASHLEREAVVERLQDAAAEGRLDFAELDARVEQALNAKTHAELAALTADLPHPAGADADRTLTLRAGMHGVKRTGPWQVPARILVDAGMGGAVLDFTAAECRLSEVRVEAHGQMGGVVLVVPKGWAVNTDEMDGGVKDKLIPGRLPGAPLIRLTGTAGMAGVVVRHPKRRELRRSRQGKELAQG